MPGFISPLFQQVFMTKDTWLFQTFMKATQYSDFLARYTKYTYLKEKKGMMDMDVKSPEYKKLKQELLEDIIEDFVNYDVAQHKMLQYANDMGMVRFTKYFLRTQRVIAKKWKTEPVNNIISVGLQHVYGDVSDINDSFIIGADLPGKIALGDVLGDATEPMGISFVDWLLLD